MVNSMKRRKQKANTSKLTSSPPRSAPPPPTTEQKIELWRQKYAPNEQPWQPPGFNQPPKAKPAWLLRAQREIINADRSLHRNTSPPSPPSTDPALERMRRVNSDIGTVHRIMNEPGPRWEPQPSLGNEPWRFPRR
jgi:hypothetical protein